MPFERQVIWTANRFSASYVVHLISVRRPSRLKEAPMVEKGHGFSGRVNIIRAVRTPLAFFTLVVLVSEGILGGLATRAEGTDFTLIVAGMLLTLILLVVSVTVMALNERRTPTPFDQETEADTLAELRDPDFWSAVCDAIAVPVFVKKRETGDAKHEHLCHNTALDTFEEVHVGRYPRSDAIEDAIKRDHEAGDDEAYTNESSIQIEVGAHGQPDVQKIPILTLKRKFTYKGADYLVGTYKPLTGPPPHPTGKIRVKYVAGQIPLALPSEERLGEGPTIEISLGEAIGLCFAEERTGRVQNTSHDQVSYALTSEDRLGAGRLTDGLTRTG